jgi:hypothetical protein
MMVTKNTSTSTGQQDDADLERSPYDVRRPYRGIRYYGQDDKDSLAALMAQGLVQFTDVRDVFSRNAQYPHKQVVLGEVLLDDEGYVVRGTYVEDQETAELQMRKFGPSGLATLAKQLQRTGFYTSGEPSGLILNKRGYSVTDVGAFINFMRYANQRGLIVQSLAGMLAGMSAVVGDSGTKVKVTSDEDVKYYLEQAFYSRLGRAPRKSEIDAALKVIQDNERKAAAASRQQPSVAAAAVAQAQKMNPAERAAYQLGNAIKLAFSTLGGQA